MADSDAVISADSNNPGSRAAAGQDSRKRRQILDGARRVFLAHGFDAASMSDIADDAGVSKGTLYVYFDSKEDLFRALVAEEKAAQFPAIFAALDPGEADVRTVLIRLGTAFTGFMMQPHVVTAKRTIVAMADRMPAMATEFFEQGPLQCMARLAEYFNSQVAAGRLVIPDTELAAMQFLDLTQSTLSLPLLFGVRAPASEARIAEVVESAVTVFLAAYSAATGDAGASRGSN
jgi:AcrR family transcriptional regulator